MNREGVEGLAQYMAVTFEKQKLRRVQMPLPQILSYTNTHGRHYNLLSSFVYES